MESSDVKRLGLILAVQAEIEGMKAANEDCKIYNSNMTYQEYSFVAKAEELKNIAYSHADQL